MFRMRFLCLLMALCAVFSLAAAVSAAEVDSDSVYCFTSDDFSKKEKLAGICVTGLPKPDAGTVMLDTRVICAGDILTAEQLTKLTFSPLKTETDKEAIMTYLPIYENRVDKPATMTISIRGKEDKAPIAKDQTLETYKNLPNDGKLQVSDPEGAALTYTVDRQPKRGTVEVREDGTFTYTPKKNKVGIDSFTYTATDPAGNVSNKATVTVQILKPTDARQYTDTVGTDCRFAAEWMKNTGLFVGENVGGEACFFPQKAVSRGEFLAMTVKALDIPLEDVSYDQLPSDTPQWLKPYLAAAIRSGLTAGLPKTETGSFEADTPISGGEAAVMLQNVLDLAISKESLEVLQTNAPSKEEVPVWASVSLRAMEDNGIILPATEALTREQVSLLLYDISHIAPESAGMIAIRKH